MSIKLTAILLISIFGIFFAEASNIRSRTKTYVDALSKASIVWRCNLQHRGCKKDGFCVGAGNGNDYGWLCQPFPDDHILPWKCCR